MKNEKLLLDIQTKCDDIASEILNAMIDAERTFKCKRPYVTLLKTNNRQIYKKRNSGTVVFL